jgi:hypothetical protein
MALAAQRGALAGLGQFAVGADAVLGLSAPVESVVGRWDGWVALGEDKHALPTKRWTEARVFRIEAFGIAGHGNLIQLFTSHSSQHRA